MISRHQNIQNTAILVPIQLDATVEVAVPIFGEFVLFLEALTSPLLMYFTPKSSIARVNDIFSVTILDVHVRR
jgi:hypothetical protein